MTEITGEAWPSRSALLEMAGAFRVPCALGAAAELDVWSVLGDERLTAEEVAGRLDADLRGPGCCSTLWPPLRVLAKSEDRYSVRPTSPPSDRRDAAEHAPDDSPRHEHSPQLGQLAWVVKAGIPAPRQASIRGFDADRAAFIAAMHVVSGPIAGDVVARLAPLNSGTCSTWGGLWGRGRSLSCGRWRGRGPRSSICPTRSTRPAIASPARTWPIAWPSRPATSTATISRPGPISPGSARSSTSIRGTKPGAVRQDFPGPGGGRTDRHSRHRHGARPHAAVVGALFAINMLVNTDRGGTFTFGEIAEDLQAVGFREPELKVRSDEMSSVVLARKPK